MKGSQPYPGKDEKKNLFSFASVFEFIYLS